MTTSCVATLVNVYLPMIGKLCIQEEGLGANSMGTDRLENLGAKTLDLISLGASNCHLDCGLIEGYKIASYLSRVISSCRNACLCRQVSV